MGRYVPLLKLFVPTRICPIYLVSKTWLWEEGTIFGRPIRCSTVNAYVMGNPCHNLLCRPVPLPQISSVAIWP